MPQDRKTSRFVILIVLVALVASAWTSWLDTVAERQVDAGFKRALASFAVARTLNAVISVAKGTQVAVQPAGFGLVLTPGEALQPIDALIEQFAALMLAASIAFGLQKVLIAIGAHWVFSLVLTAAAAMWGWRLWRAKHPPGWLTITMLALLFIRFAVPVVTVGSDLVFRTFLEDKYHAGQAAMSLSSQQFAVLSSPTVQAPVVEGMGDRISRWWSSASANLDVRKRFEELKDVAEHVVDHVVNVIVVFLLQTLLVPLLLLWVLARAFRLVHTASARRMGAIA
jgi:hypothetical protein